MGEMLFHLGGEKSAEGMIKTHCKYGVALAFTATYTFDFGFGFVIFLIHSRFRLRLCPGLRPPL